jgi:hypothetical protein
MDSEDEPVNRFVAKKKKRRPTQSPTRNPTRLPTQSPTPLKPFDQGREAGRDEANRLWNRVSQLIDKFVIGGGIKAATGAQGPSIKVPALV